jgi:ABC-2 type transport system ATP-binding protein
VSDVEVEGNRVRLHVRGSVEPLLERLAVTRVTQLLSREPSLEELFFAQYGAGQARQAREVSGDVR